MPQEHQDNKRMLSNWFFNEEDNKSMANPLHGVASDFIEALRKENDKTGTVEVAIALLRASSTASHLTEH